MVDEVNKDDDDDGFEFEIEDEEIEEESGGAGEEASTVATKEDSDDDASYEVEATQEHRDEPDEKEKHGKRAEKRIRNLVRARKELEEKLAAETNARLEAEENLKAQRATVDQTQDFAVSQYEERIQAEEAALKTAYLSAEDEGDREKVWDIQKRLAQTEAGRLNLEQWKQQQKRSKVAESAPEREAEPAKKGTPLPKADPRALSWAKKNNWFGKNEEMTLDALDIHRDLVEEGVDAKTKEYYSELDKRIREMHPKSFKQSAVNSNVAGSSRVAPTKTNKVKISAAQKAYAERHKIPLDRYAREVAKIQARDTQA
jgi:hypothetical protein